MKLRCPLCRDTFSWKVEQGFPKHCPQCGEYIGSDGKDEVVIPFISKAKNLGADRVYRQMEQSSEARMEAAAEATGLPKSEFSSMKVTDMNTQLREGDMAFKPTPPSKEMQSMIDSNPGRFGFQQGQNGAEFARSTGVGPHPHAGAGALNTIRSMHSANGFQTNVQPGAKS